MKANPITSIFKLVFILALTVLLGSCQRPNDMEEGEFVSDATTEEAATSEGASEEASVNTGDCEEIARYESFVNRYVNLMRKVSNGDMSSMQESISLMQEAEVVGNEIANAGERLYSPECWSLFMSLQNRLVNAAAEISGDYSSGTAQQDMNKMMNDAQKDVDRMMRDAQKDVDRMMRDAERDVDNMMQDYN